jgi:hypothetical protein
VSGSIGFFHKDEEPYSDPVLDPRLPFYGGDERDWGEGYFPIMYIVQPLFNLNCVS